MENGWTDKNRIIEVLLCTTHFSVLSACSFGWEVDGGTLCELRHDTDSAEGTWSFSTDGSNNVPNSGTGAFLVMHPPRPDRNVTYAARYRAVMLIG